MPKVRKHRRPRGWALLTAVGILKPVLLAAMEREWIDGEKIPAEGGCIFVINHVSHLDPLTSAHIVYDHGRSPRYLAKSGLFHVFFVGTILRGAKQIPVQRMTADAASAYDAAVAAVNAGEALMVYPEGTITRDPGGWPMRGKTGAARIALATRAPVIPIAQWGVQDLLPAYSKKPHFLPRKKVTVKVGDPIELDDLFAQGETPETIRLITERIVNTLATMVGELRGETPPTVRFDPRDAGISEIGNPHRKPEKGTA